MIVRAKKMALMPGMLTPQQRRATAKARPEFDDLFLTGMIHHSQWRADDGDYLFYHPAGGGAGRRSFQLRDRRTRIPIGPDPHYVRLMFREKTFREETMTPSAPSLLRVWGRAYFLFAV